MSAQDDPAVVPAGVCSAGDMRRYIAHSVAHKHLVEAVPGFGRTRTLTASTCVFVSSR